MWTFLNNLFFGNRIVTIQQFRDVDNKSHVFVVTGRKVVELSEDGKTRKSVVTAKEIKHAK